MIKLTDITFTIEQIAGSDIVLLTDIREVYKYDDANNRTNVIDGYKHTVVAPAKKYTEFNIKTAKSFVTPEQLAATKDGVIKIKVRGFAGRFYRTRDREYAFTSTAESLEIVAQ